MLYIDDNWFVITPLGEGRVRLVSDHSYNENPTVLVELCDGDYRSFDIIDIKSSGNGTYGIKRGEFHP